MKLLVIIFIGFVSLLCSCRQNQSDKTNVEFSTKTQKDSTIFDKYDSWLMEIKDTKHKKIFTDILKRIHEPHDSCSNETIMDLADKTKFQSIFNEFRFFDFEDKYIAIRGFNSWTSQTVGTIFALVDKKDSIISFKYDCIDQMVYTGGGYLDTIYVKDWNKNGSLDLITKEFKRISGYKNYNIVIYDLKISENQFNPLFFYTESGFSKVGMDRIHEEWKDTFRFITPEIIEKTSLNWYVVDTIRRKDYDDDETFKNKKAAQNDWLKEFAERGNELNSAKKIIYKFNKKTKTFLNKNEKE
jgi:hypothetical protein